MNNKLLKVAWAILYMSIFTIWTIYYFSNNPAVKEPIIIIWNNWTATTWSGEPATIIDDGNEHKLIIFSWSYSASELDITKYPKIKVNLPIKNWKILYEIEVVDGIKEYGYFTSNNFYFAFRFFLWDFKNGWYFNVFRNINNGVWNDADLNLNWAISWRNLLNWFIWEIPLSPGVRIARDKDSYGYAGINTLDIFNSYIWKEINIWGFLSSIKEFPEGGWKITKIKSITIIYEWEKKAIEIIK